MIRILFADSDDVRLSMISILKMDPDIIVVLY
jgi:hypothetical protein